MKTHYLPVHVQMAGCLKKGHSVLHNGNGKRQGTTGTITRVNQNNDREFVCVEFSKAISQFYSKKWFLENFYISVEDIMLMGGLFNGTPYVTKYDGYELPATAFIKTHRMTHGQCKSHLATLAIQDVPVTEEVVVEVPHKVGEYKLCRMDGTLISDHKTQHIAEQAGSTYTQKNEVHVRIWHCIANIEPVVTVKANIIRN